MKLTHDYMEYLKDNPEGYWFKNKIYGFGWVPASKEGWITVGVFVLWVIAVVTRFEKLGLPESATVQQTIAPVFFGVFVLLVISWKTGEPLRWNWKGKKSVHMRLHEEPFLKIQSGQKKVEVRLYDEKRSRLKKGDVITFVSRQNPDASVSKKVSRIVRFATFEELFAKYPSEQTDIYHYYTEEDEKKSGVVAIELA